MNCIPLKSLTLYVVNSSAYLDYYFASHNKTEREEHIIEIYKTSYGFSVAYPIACALPKLSLCLYYLEIFPITQRPRRWITKGIMAFEVVNMIAWLVPTIAVCIPIAQYWSPGSLDRRCIDIDKFGTWISFPRIISDLIMITLPLPMLYKLVSLTNLLHYKPLP